MPVYGVILADPPWAFTTYSAKGKGRSAEAHYDCMDLAAIRALPIGSWAARDAVLYLWATVPHLEHALAVMAAWGFAYRSGFVWIKERIGTGYWARNRHEHLLIGARGSKVCPPRGLAVDSVIEGQQRQHSRKPDRARAIIERYHPDALKLELFARETRPGWSAWGAETGLLDHGPVATRRWASGAYPGAQAMPTKPRLRLTDEQLEKLELEIMARDLAELSEQELLDPDADLLPVEDASNDA